MISAAFPDVNIEGLHLLFAIGMHPKDVKYISKYFTALKNMLK
jgi:hypothetical protein